MDRQDAGGRKAPTAWCEADVSGSKRDVRLIERWLPITALGIESVRERTPMTPFPAPNRLHVWWARRPLVASRVAVLASLLPADADHDRFMHAIGIHGDPVAARDPQSTRRHKRAAHAWIRERHTATRACFQVTRWTPTDRRMAVGIDRCRRAESEESLGTRVVLDPTAGGGSIPFESVQGSDLSTLANDLNPVSGVESMAATVELAWGTWAEA